MMILRTPASAVKLQFWNTECPSFALSFRHRKDESNENNKTKTNAHKVCTDPLSISNFQRESVFRTAMLSLRDIATLNNEGAHHLKEGDFSSAMEVFATGFAFMYSVTQRFVDYTTFEKHHQSRNESIVPAISLSSYVLQLRKNAQLEALPQQGHFFVGDKPLMLCLDESDIFTVTTFLQFNLGLAFHQLGLRSGSGVLLRHAFEAYDRTLFILCNYTVDRKKYGVIMCLAVNNLAHLHYEFCEFEASRSCIDCLNYLIMAVGCLDDVAVLRHLSPNECDQLKLNVLHAKLPFSAAAA